MNVVKQIFEIRSCIEILANDIKNRHNWSVSCSTVNKELQRIHTGGSSTFTRSYEDARSYSESIIKRLFSMR